MIPYGRQDVTAADIEAVAEVLRSDFLTQGPVVPQFEQAVARYCGAGHAVAVNSATSALHLACLALGVGPGDLVWTSPITFVASANCALYCGAEVDFVDIDARTYNMSVPALHEKLEGSRRVGRLPKVIIPVHLCGQSCDMREIHALSQEYGFRIIEDAAHAIGGRYQARPIGDCRYSDITVFSFHPVKIITTAEGGMALTNDANLANRMGRLRSHGITRDAAEMAQGPDGSWYYEQIDLGFNYRMTDMQAALGLSQIARLDSYVSQRHDVAAVYEDLLKNAPVVRPWQAPDTHSAFHLYVIRINAVAGNVTHREVFEQLRRSGVGVNLHYIPLYRQPYYARMGFSRDSYPQAERYYAEAITLPLYPALTDEQQAQIVQHLLSSLDGKRNL